MDLMRSARKKKGMTMKELGKAVGVSESTISLYETGKHEPDLVTLSRIADVLDVTVDELLGRSPVVSTAPWDPEQMDYADKEDETISILSRGIRRMSPENRQKLLEIVRVMFREYFDEEGHMKGAPNAKSKEVDQR